jgi:O-antigen ligase
MYFLKKSVIGLLLATAFTPLIVFLGVVNPYVFPKAIFFRSLIEVTLIFALLYAAWHLINKPAESLRRLSERLRLTTSNPLVISLALFFISLVISTFLAIDRYWAFWGPIERAEGLWGMLHLLCFFILVSIFFDRSHWVLFFKISLVIGVAVSLRAFMEYFGIFNFKQIDRPSSYAGNASFLAIQMIFLTGLSALIFFESNNSIKHSRIQAWQIGALTLGTLFVVTLFLTGTRATMLGFIIGSVIFLVYFSFQKTAENKSERENMNILFLPRMISYQAISRFLLAFLIIISTVFFATRDASIWHSIPGLDRITQISTLGNIDETYQIRLGVWQVSFDAFRERPFFGWGLENFIVAAEQHYTPHIANYGEFWWDRAHNKLLEVLVMQGGFGLLTYLSLFLASIYSIANLRHGPKAILYGTLTAYFIHNLFFFDVLLSYIYFIALLGYVFRLKQDEQNSQIVTTPNNSHAHKSNLTKVSAYTLATAAITSIPLLTASLYQLNWTPFAQARLYQSSTQSTSANGIVSTLSTAMNPYNFAQTGIRTQAIDDVYLHQFFHNDAYRMDPKHAPLGDIIMKGMQDIIDRHPNYDARYYTRKVEMMNGYARSDPSYYAKAEPLIRKALKIAPNHHEIHYHLAFNLAGQGKLDEAVKAAQYVVNLSPGIVVARLRLAFMYAMAGDRVNSQKEIRRVNELDPTLKRLSENDKKMLGFLYKKWGIND